MPKYQYDRAGGPYEYPSLGLRIADNDVVELDSAPDQFFTLVDSGTAVTVVAGGGSGYTAYEEPADGALAVYDRSLDRAVFSETALSDLAVAADVSATYASLDVVRQGRRRDRPFPALVQKTMSSPPTIGALATATAIASAVHWPSVSGAAPLSPAHFTALGAGSPVRYGSSFPDTLYVGYTSTTTTSSATTPYIQEFMFDGTTLEINFKGMAGGYRLRVDGELVAAAAAVAQTGSTHFLPVTFATRAVRRITFEAAGLPWGGVRTGPNDTIWPISRRGPRCIILGDSFTEGAGTGTNYGGVIGSTRTFADLMGWPDTWNSGVGGTGYLAPGSAGRVKFRDRVQADVIAHAPDVVIVAGGANDSGYTAEALEAEAALLFDAIRDGLPDCRLYVVGPYFRGGNAATFTPVQAAIFAAAADYADGTIDTCTSPWFTGSGRVGATTGSGNSDLYIGTDNVHPTIAGHDYLARRLAESITALLDY